MIAEVIINRTAKKLNKTFDYHVPSNLETFIFVGSKVLVPFGKSGKLEEAFVVGLKENTNFNSEIKDIARLEEQLESSKIELAKWMAKRYFCNVSDCIKLMLTPGTRTKNRENRIQEKKVNRIYLSKTKQEIEQAIKENIIKTPKQKKALEFISKNEGFTVPEIEEITGCSRSIINTLTKNGYLKIVEEKIDRNPLQEKDTEKIKQSETVKKLELTGEQKEAYNKVEDTIKQKQFKTFLLYGVTGSRQN